MKIVGLNQLKIFLNHTIENDYWKIKYKRIIRKLRKLKENMLIFL